MFQRNSGNFNYVHSFPGKDFIGNIVAMASDLSRFQRDIDAKVHVASSWGLQLHVGKCCVMRFARKKSSVKRSDSSVCKLLCSWSAFAVCRFM